MEIITSILMDINDLNSHTMADMKLSVPPYLAMMQKDKKVGGHPNLSL
jgi:hypothetical protein